MGKSDEKSKKVNKGLVGIVACLMLAPLISQQSQVVEAKEKVAVEQNEKRNGVKKKLTSQRTAGKTEVTELKGGYRLENNVFQVETGQHGEISSLKIVGDAFETNYVMNEVDNPAQATAGHQWFGELMFRTKKGDTEVWQKEYTGPSITGRKVTLDGEKVIVTYENASEENGIKNLKVTETYALVEDQLQWRIDVKNTSGEKIIIGDFGLPLPFREYWTYPTESGESSSTKAYEGSVLDHSFVGNDASYIYATRPSGMGNYLVMTPDVSTGAGFEYQDHWIINQNGRTKEEEAWSMDQAGWANGLNVFYIHSEAIKGENKGYLENTALTLEKDQSKTYIFNFSATDVTENTNEAPNMSNTKYEEELKSILYRENIMDAVSVPGMIIPKDSTGKALGKMYLHTPIDAKDISFDYECMHNDQLTGGDNNHEDVAGVAHIDDGASAIFKETKFLNGEQYHIYDIEFSELGNNNIVVNYEIEDETKSTVLQYYIIANPEEALAEHSNFLLKTQWDTPGKLQDKVFDDWMMDTKSKRGEFGGYWGWGDDWGLVHGTYLAEMNSVTPVEKQVKALDEYLDIAIWNGLMQEHQEDYLIHDFLMEEPNSTPTYRGFAYPHIYNTYFAMYKIARDNPDLIDYKEQADTYLLRCYNIMAALYKDGVGFNWHTGVMGEVSTPDILAALKERGFANEAKKMTEIMKTKHKNFSTEKYPYVSEYPFDNTSEEAIYMLGNMFDDTKMMSMVDLKTRASRGVQPIWYHYGNPTTICGENWFNFQYTASLAGTAMDNWLREQENQLSEKEKGLAARANYAGKIANLVHINSGQINSDPENIGTVSWTYQAELGNYKALGTGGGQLHNGWRQMSGEADLALYGALQILSSDVAIDPIFGVLGYGAEVTEKDGKYHILPKDGLRTRVNLINQQFSLELKTDKYTKAEIAKDGSSLSLDIETVSKKAHDSILTISDPQAKKGESYQVKFGGKVIGSYEVTGTTTELTLPLSGKNSTLEIEKGELLSDTEPEITVPEKQTVTLDEAQNLRLLGSAKDNAWLQKQAGPEWVIKSQPEEANVIFSDAKNSITTATFNKVGTYQLLLKATGHQKNTEKEVVVEVLENKKLPAVLAHYDFEEANLDVIGNSIRNIADGGFDGVLKGNIDNTKTTTGKNNEGTALSMNGKVGGYVQLPYGLTNHVSETTISMDVNLTAKQVSGSRLFEFKGSKDNQLFVSFVNDNELSLSATQTNGKVKTVNSGISLAPKNWRNVELTLKDNQIILYCDGNEVAKLTDSKVRFSEFSDLQRSFIGRADSESSPWLNAGVDNFLMLSKALSKEEIMLEYGNEELVEIEELRETTQVTSVKVAPQLPEQVVASFSNGTIRRLAVVWEDITMDQYAKPGSFVVEGTVEGTEKKAKVNVMVVKGVETNVGLTAKPSGIIDSVHDLGGVAGLNDGFEPKNSRDTSHGVWHNWLGNQSGESWVEYTWEDSLLISGMDTYYFFNGAHFAPASVRIEYLDETGKWQEFQNVEGLEVTLDQYNYTTFTPVNTKKVRMYLTPATLATGIVEWKVYGYSDGVAVDTTQLSQGIRTAQAIKESVVVAGFNQMQTNLDEAKKIQEMKEVTQTEVDKAAFGLIRSIAELVPKEDNFAFLASKSTSYISGWESLDAINDGLVPDKSTEKTVPAYGSWGNASDSETITYEWLTPVSLTKTGVYFWTDGGGILPPKSFQVDYLDQDGKWQKWQEAEVVPLLDTFNYLNSESGIQTTQLRITMFKVANDESGLGVFEWQAFGEKAVTSSDKSPLIETIALAETLVEKDYSSETWQALQEVLGYAKELVADDKSLAYEIDLYVTRLHQAIENLEENTELPEEIVPESISLNITGLKTAKKGSSLMLETTFVPVTTTATSVTYHSSNDGIASVDAQGVVTAHKEGTVTIKVKTVNEKTATFRLAVKK